MTQEEVVDPWEEARRLNEDKKEEKKKSFVSKLRDKLSRTRVRQKKKPVTEWQKPRRLRLRIPSIKGFLHFVAFLYALVLFFLALNTITMDPTSLLLFGPVIYFLLAYIKRGQRE